MDYYFKAIRNYAVFTGRATRTEYWVFALIDFIVVILAIIFDIVLGTSPKSYINGAPTFHYGYIFYTYLFALLIPRIAVFVRRMHDIDKSGWLALLIFIPIVGSLFGFVLALLPGTNGPNDFGEDPKMQRD